MKTNREKLLQDAFVMFLQYNYERASYSLLTQATGISKAGISYYYPTKQELFVAVVDRYFINVHDADVKFTPAASLLSSLTISWRIYRRQWTGTWRYYGKQRPRATVRPFPTSLASCRRYSATILMRKSSASFLGKVPERVAYSDNRCHRTRRVASRHRHRIDRQHVQ